MTDATFDFDGQPIEIVAGDSILLALCRAGMRPTRGGTLCFGGDCPHCLCTVDGVAYVRACQTVARAGADVASHPSSGDPVLSDSGGAVEPVGIEHRHVEVVVVGGGQSGRAAFAAAQGGGRSAALLDASGGDHVVGVYPGPVVVVRTEAGMIHVDCEAVIVATGASEIQPVVPGSDLAGLYTPHAAAVLASAGVDLGTTVSVGADDLVHFEGRERVEAVVTRRGDGGETRTPCNSVIVDLGRYPRSGLARMADPDIVSVVGDAAAEAELPVCPSAGVVCPCSGTTIEQLDDLFDRGFTQMELLKRGSLAGTGTCQGGVCTPYLRSFLGDRGEPVPPAFTARPMARPLTMDEIAAGSFLPSFARTALDQVHRDLGAHMDRVGGWWRPWNYGDTDAEYRAVRERVSVGDVSTLGKMMVTGPDAEATLQRLYPTDVSTIRPGRTRYALLLNERGFVFDDGIIAREHDGTFFLTFTSGGASTAEMWIRDWAATWGHDVRILNRTYSLGAINVTGPQAANLLARVGLEDPPAYLAHAEAVVAGVPCKVFRLGFTGEVSFELHHPAIRSVELWNALVDQGRDLGIMAHGIEALFRLRLEKGHILVGQDTDYDSTPQRLQHDWAVDLDKDHDFIGRRAVVRTRRIPLDRKLVGFEADRPFAFEGASAWSGDEYAGYLTSITWSPVLGRAVALGWLECLDDGFPESVTVEGVDARVVRPHFYDPDGVRARA